MKATDFTFATKEIQSRIFDEPTCKKIKWCEASKEQNEAINNYPCEIQNAPNGFTVIFIEGFAEISNPDFGSFFAKTESGIKKIKKYIETGAEFEIVGDEVK
jgi:hypothetical protein